MFDIVKKNIEITGFERIVLSECTMRGRHEYEIVNDGDKAVVNYYMCGYSNRVEEKKPEKSAECENAEVINILNECKISKWDGFHGKHPKHVKDGTMFSFEAIINNDLKIYADGSENFPKNYSTLTSWFREKLFK